MDGQYSYDVFVTHADADLAWVEGWVASSYHIKVAVRDDEAAWLSSGNWQSSNHRRPSAGRAAPGSAVVYALQPRVACRDRACRPGTDQADAIT